MNLTPLGFRVLVSPEDLENTSDGGIVIPDSVKDRHNATTQTGTIVDVGPTAWASFDKGTPWAKVGDRIVYAKYSSKRILDPESGKVYVLCNDDDCLAKLGDK